MHHKIHAFVWLVVFTLFISSANALARDLPDFTQLAADNASAVVNISTRQHKPGKKSQHPQFNMPGLPEGSPFNELFKRFFDEDLGGGLAERDTKSLGSGFIISEDGYLLTNYHVVNKADEIIVHLSDRKSFDAELIGVDKGSDIAVLKIDAKNLPTLKLGSSKDLKVGEWVLAIGSPFGFDHTVTAGIVSAKGRSLPSENYVPFIQTDVAINPGNSGGPLFNLDGEVVGINSQIYSRTGGFMGLSFAIPIELAISVSEQIRDNGHVSRGYLGVLIQDVDRELAESFGLDYPHGALVSKIIPDSPAEDADLQIGDVILEFNGKPLRNSSQLPPMVGTTVVGESVKLKIMRNKKEEETSIRVGELPRQKEQTVAAKEVSTEKKRLGLTIHDLTDEQRESLGITEGGVLVTGVESGPASQAGIRKDDVILRFNNKPLLSVKDLEKALKTVKAGESIAVLVQKKDGPVFLAMHIPE